MAKGNSKETPLMKQYNATKAKYPDALLLFRVGDFYETFGEDAITASRILNITLTKRANGAASEVALAGFPYHAIDTYMPRLVKAGQRVAICDQLEDPKDAIGIVKRGVTELVTPGISLHDNLLEGKRNNFLAALHYHSEDKCGVSLCDISTGEYYCAEGNLVQAEKILEQFQVAEVLFAKPQRQFFSQRWGDRFNTFAIEDWVFQQSYGYDLLVKHFKTLNLKGFGIEELPLGITAAGAILYYLNETEHKQLGHLLSIARLEEEKFVWLDKFTIRNLELLFPQQEKGVPLIEVLDHTDTPMGARLLRQWVVMPLKDKLAIEKRLEIVSALHDRSALQDELSRLFKQVGDLERLISKVASLRASPRDLGQLRRSLKLMPEVALLLNAAKSEALSAMAMHMPDVSVYAKLLEDQLLPELPAILHQAPCINSGIDAALDELRNLSQDSKTILQEIQQREAQATGIPSLKISFNKVFGYYLEVTHAHREKVPSEWIRKQTLVNAERYITPELKEYEEKILTAESKIKEIEERLFQQLIAQLQEAIPSILQIAKVIAGLDCLLSFARVSIKNQYCRPTLSESLNLDISQGRHPVIETLLPPGESFVPNDIELNDSGQQIIIITGPNMAGKSALLRQTALIVLMAQIGCFVPAKEANIGLVDKIFTRVGASDNLSRGESTFMVEMTETASILNNLSERSLILMDEIGRGTSTYDGVSIAWAIVEFLHENPRCRPRTLFATHYHELNALSETLNRVKNFNVAVKEVGEKVVFLRKLKPGGSHHSFGIHVAQMAGIPNTVVFRANEVLKHLEKEHSPNKRKDHLKEVPKQSNYQLSFFEPVNPAMNELGEILQAIEINSITPMQALLKLHELKSLYEKGKA